jgi:hypothetical protein
MADPEVPATSVPVITYERGTEIVEQVVANGQSAHALRGTLTIKGQEYDTLERLDGRVWLRPGTYTATVEESPSGMKEKGSDGKWRKRRQIRPSHSFKAFGGTGPAPILFHPGNTPNDFEGCIGVGSEDPKGIVDSVKSMEEIFDLLGGFEVGTVVTIVVKGELPAKK